MSAMSAMSPMSAGQGVTHALRFYQRGDHDAAQSVITMARNTQARSSACRSSGERIPTLPRSSAACTRTTRNKARLIGSAAFDSFGLGSDRRILAGRRLNAAEGSASVGASPPPQARAKTTRWHRGGPRRCARTAADAWHATVTATIKPGCGPAHVHDAFCTHGAHTHSTGLSAQWAKVLGNLRGSR